MGLWNCTGNGISISKEGILNYMLYFALTESIIISLQFVFCQVVSFTKRLFMETWLQGMFCLLVLCESKLLTLDSQLNFMKRCTPKRIQKYDENENINKIRDLKLAFHSFLSYNYFCALGAIPLALDGNWGSDGLPFLYPIGYLVIWNYYLGNI